MTKSIQGNTQPTSNTGILTKYSDADRGLVEIPTLSPHLGFHIVDGDRVILRSNSFDTAVSGSCFADVIPLLDGSLSRRSIMTRLSDKHSAIDVQTALVFLASRGFLVSADFKMNRELAAFWSSLGASPRWAEERLSGQTISIVGDIAYLDESLRELGLRISDEEPTFCVVSADYRDQVFSEFDLRNRETGVPWLPVDPAVTNLMLGPVFIPCGSGPCWECLATRLSANRQVEKFLQNIGVQNTGVPTASFPALSRAFSGLVAAEIAKWMVFQECSGLHRQVLTLTPSDFHVTYHSVVRRPQCRTCGDALLSRTDREPVPVQLQPSPKPIRNSGGLRSIPPSETLDRYRHLVSPVSGVVSNLERISDHSDPWLHVYASKLGNFAASGSMHYALRGIRIRSAGKGSTPMQSEASALGEGLERVSGTFSGDEIRTRCRFVDFLSSGKDEAIHPDKVQLFSDHQFDQAAYVTECDSVASWVPERFDPEASIDWSPVWSLTQERHRYLPTALLYFDAPLEIGCRFGQGNSNGCSAGNTIEEAILQGFFELVERDCVAVWWYIDCSGQPWIFKVSTIPICLMRCPVTMPCTETCGCLI